MRRGRPRRRDKEGGAGQGFGARSRNRPDLPAPPWPQVGGMPHEATVPPAPGAIRCRSLARVRSCARKPESTGRFLAARTKKAVVARTPAASTRRGAAIAAWAAVRSGCPGPAAAGRRRRLGATRPEKVSDAACDPSSVRAGRLQRLVALAGSLPGDVQRPCHARRRDAVHEPPRAAPFRASEADKCCADATGRVDFASKRYRPTGIRRARRNRRASAVRRLPARSRVGWRSAGAACSPALGFPGSAPRRPARPLRRPS